MKVPRFDRSALCTWPVAGLMSPATADTPKATDPIRLAKVIHHDHDRGRQPAQPWQTSNQASALATRKQIEPTASGRHTVLVCGLGGEVYPHRIAGTDVEVERPGKLHRGRPPVDPVGLEDEEAPTGGTRRLRASVHRLPVGQKRSRREEQ